MAYLEVYREGKVTVTSILENTPGGYNCFPSMTFKKADVGKTKKIARCRIFSVHATIQAIIIMFLNNKKIILNIKRMHFYDLQKSYKILYLFFFF